MSERPAKDVVEGLFLRQQAAHPTVLDDLVAEDMVDHAAGPRGREGLNLILATIATDLGPVVVKQHLIKQHLIAEKMPRRATNYSRRTSQTYQAETEGEFVNLDEREGWRSSW